VVSWKKVAIAFFYNTIKSFVRQVAGGLLGSLATVPDDLIMAIVGYLIHTRTQYKDEGEALLLASVASLGATAGALFFRPAPAPAPTPTPAPTLAPAPAPAPRAVITPVRPQPVRPQPLGGRRVIM
jgi:hypothetical protein